MLRRASMGFLFCPSPQTLQAAAGIRVAKNYSEILAAARQLWNQQAVDEICAQRA
jgi:hypothetical protein